MISLFSVASSDQSVYYLGQLFGTVGTVLVPNSSAITFGIMGMIFKSLNTTALILGAILVTQTTVVGLLKTATEGEFLGKQWSSMWVPFRMVLGITTLFPTAAGYSVLQIVLMWVIIQGVGAADSLWTVVLNYVNVFGSPYSTVSLPTTVDVTQNLKTLFIDLTCESSAKANFPITYPTDSGQHSYYYCTDHANDPFCTNDTLAMTVSNSAGGPGNTTTAGQASAVPTAIVGAAEAMQNNTRSCTNASSTSLTCNFGPNGACGSMTFGNYKGACTGATDIGTTLQCAAYTAQDAAMSWIVNLFYNAAADFATFDYSYLTFYNNLLLNPPSNATPTWISNYCQAQGIQPNNCCFVLNPGSGVTRCRTGNADSVFPSALGTNNDYTNLGNDAISQIIWPCAIESIVSGNGTNSITCISTPPTNADFVSASTTYYKNTVNGAIATAMSAYLSNTSNLPANSWEASAQSTGWLLAGGYYYKIASTNNSNMTISMPPFVVTPADFTGSNGPNLLANYRNNNTAAGTLLAQITNLSVNSSSPVASTPGAAAMSQSMSGLAGDIYSSFQSTLTGNGSNPLVAIQSLGEKLMITAQVVYALVIVVYMLMLIASSANVMALGTGLTENPFKTAVSFIANSTYMIIAAFMGWCFTFGGLLGIYTPLVPYIIFTMGAIGWFISVIEAMVAAPFIALGILSPSGHHELLGKAEPGLMILFNTFLRPTLMIVGMMAAMLLTPVVVNMVNSGFSGVMNSIDSTPGIYELIVFISAYTSLILSVVNKSFSLIHVVPDRVLTWIGGQASDSSAGEALGAVKGGTSAAGEGASSSGQSAAGSAKGVGAGVLAAKEGKAKAAAAQTAAAKADAEEKAKK